MDKSALAMTSFKPLSKHFSRQKRSAHFGKKREKGVIVRNSVLGLTVSKASGRQYCMQSIPLAVLKHEGALRHVQCRALHAIHTACGIETGDAGAAAEPAAELHAIHTACGIETVPTCLIIIIRLIACNPYRLRY